MGCGRSRHRSPSLQPDGMHKDKTTDNRDGREGKRGGKKQKQLEKNVAKTAINKRETIIARNSPKRSTNGKTGEVKSDWQGGGATTRREVAANRDWQLEEPVDAPPDTVLAVFKSSVPASARASLGHAPNKTTSGSLSHNGSLLNGGSHKAPAVAHEIEMQMEIPVKAPSKETASAGSSKPVHITSSQLEFFKMLDEKIEKGADYTSDDE